MSTLLINFCVSIEMVLSTLLTAEMIRAQNLNSCAKFWFRFYEKNLKISTKVCRLLRKVQRTLWKDTKKLNGKRGHVNRISLCFSCFVLCCHWYKSSVFLMLNFLTKPAGELTCQNVCDDQIRLAPIGLSFIALHSFFKNLYISSCGWLFLIFGGLRLCLFLVCLYRWENMGGIEFYMYHL